MARRKRRKPTKINAADQTSPQELARVQEKHTRYVLHLGEDFPELVGVNLVKMIGYDLIQALNNAHLREIL